VGQGGLKSSTYDVTHKKAAPLKQRRLAESFEPFTGFVALTGPEKFPRKATWVLVFFSRKSPKPAGRKSVKRPQKTYICLQIVLVGS